MSPREMTVKLKLSDDQLAEIQRMIDEAKATAAAQPTAALWIDPGRQGGEVCIYGTRLPVEHAAHHLAGAEPDVDLERYCDDYGFDGPRSVLVACAWFVLFEQPRTRTKFDRQIRRAWHDWAERTWQAAWHTDAELEPPPPLNA